MRRPFLAAAALVALALPAAAQCNEMQSLPWKPAPGLTFTLQAHAIGPTCATAAVVFLIADKKGGVLYSTTRLAPQVAVFADGIKDAKSMQAALGTWLNTAVETSPKSSRELPDWPQGADAPQQTGEFGFFAGENTSREYYLGVRKAAQPLLCFVQGMESESCIVASPDGITEIGGMTFPG